MTPKFANTGASFHVELKKRINHYFTATGKDTTGGWRIATKALFLVAVLISTYTLVVFFTPAWPWALALCALLGLTTAAIGFNVMHDGGHGSFSKYKWLNKTASNMAEFVGASQFMWNMKHNVIHHAYANIDGIDDDIDAKPILRMAPTQKRYKIHKFQHLYFWIFYAFLHLYWTMMSDYRKYFTKKIGDIPLKKMSPRDHIAFWSFKILHYGLFIVLPIFSVGFVDWLIGYTVFTVFVGFTISIVFQLAHTVEHTEFPVPDEKTGKLEDEWAIHQLKTTANFATRNRLISWYVGGLNFQIEHHLFPKISHIHYPAISKIIKQACQEHGVVYVEYKRMYQAVFSHVSFLRDMGRA